MSQTICLLRPLRDGATVGLYAKLIEVSQLASWFLMLIIDGAIIKDLNEVIVLYHSMSLQVKKWSVNMKVSSLFNPQLKRWVL